MKTEQRLPRFEGKIAVVTGGASGIGHATANGFVREGARVVIWDINPETASIAEAMNATGDRVDVTDESRVETAFQGVIERFGSVDVVVNNVGADDKHEELHETGADNWFRMLRVNGDGFFYVLKHALRNMLDSGGSIVNTASTAGLKAVRNITPYTFAKAGVVGVTRSAALEYAARGIRVNTVAPGATRTPLMESFIAAADDPEAFRAQVSTMNPIPGFIEPQHVADAILFLASDEAARITGVTLPVAGGSTLMV